MNGLAARSSFVAFAVIACCACRASAPQPAPVDAAQRADSSLAVESAEVESAEDVAAAPSVEAESVSQTPKGISVVIDPTFAAAENQLATPSSWSHGNRLGARATRLPNGDLSVRLGSGGQNAVALEGEGYTFVFSGDPEAPTITVSGGRYTDHVTNGNRPDPVEVVGGKVVMSCAIETGVFHLDVKFNLRSQSPKPGVTRPFDGQFRVDVPAMP